MFDQGVTGAAMAETHRGWYAGFIERLSHYVGDSAASTWTAEERLPYIRRMLNEYRIRLAEREAHLAECRVQVEYQIIHHALYRDAKNDATRKTAHDYLLETSGADAFGRLVTEWRDRRDETAWWRYEVSRIEAELDAARDIRRRNERQAGVLRTAEGPVYGVPSN